MKWILVSLICCYFAIYSMNEDSLAWDVIFEKKPKIEIVGAIKKSRNEKTETYTCMLKNGESIAATCIINGPANGTKSCFLYSGGERGSFEMDDSCFDYIKEKWEVQNRLEQAKKDKK